ncbi:MAG: Holliday junction branch migration DNA helicase RuvB [Myxococcota bacterium]
MNARNVEPAEQGDDAAFDVSLRPRCFEEFVGQKTVVDKLKIFVAAARNRGGALDHTLLCGPPGLGKTSLSHIIAEELGVNVFVSSGPAFEKPGDLAGLLTGLGRRDVLFLDEIHRLSRLVEERLYQAMEDFRFDVVLGDGPSAQTVQLTLEPFTLIGATTRTGLLTGPMRDRFGIVERLDYYGEDDLRMIVERSASRLRISMANGASHEIARRARGTPRIANRLLRRVRDFAEVEADGVVTLEVARGALDRLEVDHLGLDPMDRRILATLIDKFDGGPVGLTSLAAAVSEATDTLEEVYEPFLIQEGLLHRTPRGRVATSAAYFHLKRSPPTGGQTSLL